LGSKYSDKKETDQALKELRKYEHKAIGRGKKERHNKYISSAAVHDN